MSSNTYHKISSHALGTLKCLMEVDLSRMTIEDYIALSKLEFTDYIYSKDHVMLDLLRRKHTVTSSSRSPSAASSSSDSRNCTIRPTSSSGSPTAAATRRTPPPSRRSTKGSFNCSTRWESSQVIGSGKARLRWPDIAAFLTRPRTPPNHDPLSIL